MVLTDLFHIPTPLSLLVIGLVLAIAIVASMLHSRRIHQMSEQAEQPGTQEAPAPPAEPTTRTQDFRGH